MRAIALHGLPASLIGGLFLVAGVAIAALHLLRVRRPRVVVPFAPLWARVLGERQKWRGWRRPRQLLSLLLSLAVLALLSLSAGDPRWSAEADGGRHARSIVVLVDASASMQVRDEKDGGAATARGGRITRGERARREVERIVSGLRAGDEALLVRLDARPQPLGPFTSDEHELLGATAALEPGEGAADLDAGLRLAADLLAGRPHPTLVLVGDGAWPAETLERARLAPGGDAGGGVIDLRGVDVRFLPVGTRSDDLGITAFAARRHPAHPADYEVLVEVRSSRATPSTVTLQIRQEGQVVDSERLEVPAGARLVRLYPDLAGQGSRLEARLLPVDERDGPLDDFPLDDRAFAVLPLRRPRRVLLVTDGNLFLEGALLADEDVVLDRVAPARFDAAEAARHDVVVLDGFAPLRPPEVPALYVDPKGPSSPIAIRGELRAPPVTSMARHPLTRFLSLADLNIASASRLALEPGDVELFSSLSEPLYVARERPRRLLLLGFDVRRSDLPLRVAFPVMLESALDWLVDDPTEAGVGEPAIAGRAVELRAPGLASLAVRGPDGVSRSVEVADGKARFEVARSGFHELGVDGAATAPPGAKTLPRWLAANLDPAESIAPAPALRLDGRILRPPDPPSRHHGSSPWRALLLVALALLFADWWAFHLRVTA